MEEKKLTKGEMERRIRNAILIVPKDKDYKGVFFDDKGLKLEVTSDFAIISTGFHRHVFNSFTAQGVSRPYMYVKRFIDIALENDCTRKDEKGNVTRSYAKLFAMLKDKEDKDEYRVSWYVDLWLNNIFHPLYTIGETECESFLVYESFLHTMARNVVIMSEKQEDMTNVQFVARVIDEMNKYMEGLSERVIFKKKTDEEKLKEEVDAVQEQMAEKTMEEQADGK